MIIWRREHYTPKIARLSNFQKQLGTNIFYPKLLFPLIPYSLWLGLCNSSNQEFAAKAKRWLLYMLFKTNLIDNQRKCYMNHL